MAPDGTNRLRRVDNERQVIIAAATRSNGGPVLDTTGRFVIVRHRAIPIHEALKRIEEYR